MLPDEPHISRCPPPTLRPIQANAPKSPIAFTNLVEYLDAMYYDTASLAACFSQCNTTRLFTDSRVSRDAQQRQTLEFVMNVPLAGRTVDIDEHSWNGVAKGKTLDYAEMMLEKARGKTRMGEPLHV